MFVMDSGVYPYILCHMLMLTAKHQEQCLEIDILCELLVVILKIFVIFPHLKLTIDNEQKRNSEIVTSNSEKNCLGSTALSKNS